MTSENDKEMLFHRDVWDSTNSEELHSKLTKCREEALEARWKKIPAGFQTRECAPTMQPTC